MGSPYTPSNLSPSDGYSTTDTTPSFSAYLSDPDGDNVKFGVDISTDSSFSNVVSTAASSWVSSGSSTSASASTSLSSGTYYWRMRASDSNYNYSGYTSTRSITIEEPNSTPALSSISRTYTEGNNYFTVHATVNDADGDTVKMFLDVATDIDFLDIVSSTSTGYYASGSSISLSSNALAEGSYHYRVRAYDGQSYEAWHDGYLISITLNGTPSTPTNLSPSDGYSTYDKTPTFSADVSDPEGDTVRLEVVVYDSNGYSYTSYGSYGTGRRSVTSQSLSEGTYTWKVRADDSYSSSSYTDLRTIYILDSDPPSISNLSPANGYTDTSGSLDFSATLSDPDGDNVKLQVQISSDTTYSSTSIKFDSTSSLYASGSSISVSTGSRLDYGTYYWRARGIDSRGDTSSWTSDRTIEVTPSDFEWSLTKTSGSEFNLLASEWNGFTSRINDFRDWKGFSTYSFSNAATDSGFLASMFNEAVNAINDMNPPTAPPSTKVGVSDVTNPLDADDILASDLNLIRDSLNSIT